MVFLHRNLKSDPPFANHSYQIFPMSGRFSCIGIWQVWSTICQSFLPNISYVWQVFLHRNLKSDPPFANHSYQIFPMSGRFSCIGIWSLIHHLPIIPTKYSLCLAGFPASEFEVWSTICQSFLPNISYVWQVFLHRNLKSDPPFANHSYQIFPTSGRSAGGKGTCSGSLWDQGKHSSSSCRAASTDIPDPLSPLLPIVHHLW